MGRGGHIWKCKKKKEREKAKLRFCSHASCGGKQREREKERDGFWPVAMPEERKPREEESASQERKEKSQSVSVLPGLNAEGRGYHSKKTFLFGCSLILLPGREREKERKERKKAEGRLGSALSRGGREEGDKQWNKKDEGRPV